jgi:hypothetical protein
MHEISLRVLYFVDKKLSVLDLLPPRPGAGNFVSPVSG